jgi:phosphoglycolate phosphatase
MNAGQDIPPDAATVAIIDDQQDHPAQLTVGFDLDMTLLDSRGLVAQAIDTMAARFGVSLAGADIAARLGPPMPTLLSEADVPAHLIPAMLDYYWAMYPALAHNYSAPMPGASEAIAAVHALGGRVVMVTGKPEPFARLHVQAHHWRIDHLAGNLWGEGKATALRSLRTNIYVGDQIDDIHAALAAGTVPVGVATARHSTHDLLRAGATVVLPELTAFPDWLTRQLHHYPNAPLVRRSAPPPSE